MVNNYPPSCLITTTAICRCLTPGHQHNTFPEKAQGRIRHQTSTDIVHDSTPRAILSLQCLPYLWQVSPFYMNTQQCRPSRLPRSPHKPRCSISMPPATTAKGLRLSPFHKSRANKKAVEVAEAQMARTKDNRRLRPTTSSIGTAS